MDNCCEASTAVNRIRIVALAVDFFFPSTVKSNAYGSDTLGIHEINKIVIDTMIIEVLI